MKLNQKFGRLTVVGLPPKALTRAYAIVRCDCGNERSVRIGNLLQGRSQSCGCWQRERTRENRRKNLLGRKFGRLVVVGDTGKPAKTNGVPWKVRCECGTECEVCSSNLVTGNTQSCGCLQREKARRGCQPGDAAKHSILEKYKNTAKRKGYIWALTNDLFYTLISKPCYYCGKEPSASRADKDGVLQANGVDRKDNTRGYLFSNVVSCCQFCQYAKRDLPHDDFLSHLQRVAEFKIWQK